MKEFFIGKKFGADALAKIELIEAILDSYAAQGYDLSVRQLYYQLVSRNVVVNSEKSYKRICALVSDARYAGLLDWNMIRDRGRVTASNPHWADPAEFIEQAAPQYRFDLWKDQDSYVEVMVEKQALEGVLIPVCRQLDVGLTANKGYTSSSALYEASKRFLVEAEAGKQLFIIYLGDHDPSGMDMNRDIQERMDTFLETYRCEVHRVALNIDQIEELHPPPNPAKTTDSRSAAYVERYGQHSWELDAIEPAQLATIVRDAVRGLMNQARFDRNVRKMRNERDALLGFAKKWRAGKK